MPKKHTRPPDLLLGALPVAVLERTLEIELDPGDVVLSGAAQIHAERRHPDEYARCQPHVASVIANPLYAGDDLRNGGKIELIGRVPAVGGLLLVAVNLEMDATGRYHVASFYPISEAKAQSRKEKGFLRVARWT